MCDTHLNGDPENCGVCGRSCQGLSCNNGACQSFELISGLSRAVDLAVDETHVYWTESGDAGESNGRVCRIAKEGGILDILLDSQPEPCHLAIDSTHVYWTSCGAQPSCTDGSVQSMLKDGTSPTQIAGNLENPDAIAVTASYVYWANRDGGGGAIQSAPVGGGSVTVLVSSPSRIEGIAVTSQYLFFTTNPGSVVRTNLSGAGPFTLASGPWNGGALATTADYVYYLTDSELRRVPVPGGTSQVLSSNEYDSGDVAVDSGQVYWSTVDGAKVVPEGGGTPITLAHEGDASGGLALDADHVYFTVYDRIIRAVR
jgi:hypothetical protein